MEALLKIAILILCLACSVCCCKGISIASKPSENNQVTSQYETICKEHQCVVYDKSTRLFWQRDFLQKENHIGFGMSLPEATEYCDSLVYGEFADWRLPTIEEVRTKIYGCNNAMNKEYCNVENIEESEGYARKCSCETKKGPGKYGTYLFPQIWGDDGGQYIIWTNTRAKKGNLPIIALFFQGAFITINEEYNSAGVRCVRKDEKK